MSALLAQPLRGFRLQVKYEILGTFMKTRQGWKQLAWSFGINWIVGPWMMTALAWACLPDVDGYRNGVIIIGLARCRDCGEGTLAPARRLVVAQQQFRL